MKHLREFVKAYGQLIICLVVFFTPIILIALLSSGSS
jgi:hypothetical protein